MLRQILKLSVLGLVLGIVLQQSAQAQFRGDRGGSDRDRGGSDRDREEMRRRYEEMRSRYSSGGDSSGGGFPGGGFPGGGFPGGGFPGGGFPGGGDSRGFDRGREGGDDRGRSDDRSRDVRSGDSRGTSSKPRVQFYVPTPHTPIGVDIPANYAEADTDGDGQIDLLEWRQWRPQEIAKFMMMDTNRDGFLTARELIIAENFPSELPPSISNTIAAYQTTVPTQTSSSGDANGNQSQPAPGEKPSAAEARYVFTKLDKNNNGKLDEDEWKSSKDIRAGFEKARIKISLPADQATFLNLYPAQRIMPTLPLPR